MRTSFFLCVLSAALALASLRALAQSAPASPAGDLKALSAAVRAKVQAGKTSAADLAPELNAYDALVARYAGNKSDEVAQILFQKEAVYSKILKDAAIEARAFQRGVAREQAKSAQAAMAAKGMQVNDVTDAEHERMRERVQPVWKMFIPSVGESLYKEVTVQLGTK